MGTASPGSPLAPSGVSHPEFLGPTLVSAPNRNPAQGINAAVANLGPPGGLSGTCSLLAGVSRLQLAVGILSFYWMNPRPMEASHSRGISHPGQTRPTLGPCWTHAHSLCTAQLPGRRGSTIPCTWGSAACAGVCPRKGAQGPKRGEEGGGYPQCAGV